MRFVRWQLGTLVLGASAVVVPWVDDTLLVAQRGMAGATGNLYCGLHEYADMSLVLDLLNPGDLFVDIGANVGN